MIPPPKEPKREKIERLTFMGVDPDMDKEFQDFLEYMGISYSIKEEGEWPLIEYEGHPYDIKGMLVSRFGMTQKEIGEEYPQLFS
jgi:hypothetical protein